MSRFSLDSRLRGGLLWAAVADQGYDPPGTLEQLVGAAGVALQRRARGQSVSLFVPMAKAGLTGRNQPW